jgi:Leucine-rich repeat (LRR) protein
LTNLVTLGLSSNQLTGTIPSSLGSMTWLTSLHLSNNQFMGTFPSSLCSAGLMPQVDCEVECSCCDCD